MTLEDRPTEPYACKVCGAACAADWEHCGACGASLLGRCARCRRLVPALAFCVHCGAPRPVDGEPEASRARTRVNVGAPLGTGAIPLALGYAGLPRWFRFYGAPIGTLGLGVLAVLSLSQHAYHAGFLLSLAAAALLALQLPGSRSIDESVGPPEGAVDSQVRTLPLFLALALGAITDVLAFREEPGLGPVGFWLVGMMLVIFAFRDHGAPLYQRRDWLLAALLFLVALPSRTLFLSAVPPGIHGDEADWALLALKLWRGEGPAFAYIWLGYPGTSFIPYALTLGILGSTITAARLASAIVGSLAVPGLYFLGRQAFGRLTGLLAALFLLLNVYNFQFSRMGLPNIEAVPVAIFGATALLAVCAEPGRRRQWSILGVSVGLSFMVYLTAMAWPIIAGAVLLPFVVQQVRRGAGRRMTIGIGVALAAAAITASPLMVYAARHPGSLGARANSLTIWSPDGRAHSAGSFGLKPGDEVGILRVQAQRTLESLQSRGDSSLQLGESQPSLDPVAGVGLVLGIAALVVVWRRPGAWLALAWLILSLILGGVILIDPPFAPRLVLVTPAACLIAGFGLVQVWGLVLTRVKRGRRWTSLAGVTSVLVGAVLAFGHYFGPYWQNYPNQRITALARYVRSVQDQRSVVFLGLDEPTDYVTLRFLAPRAHVERWNLDQPSPPPTDRTAVAILTPADGPDASRAARLVDTRYPLHQDRYLQNAAGHNVARVWLVH